MGPKWKFDVLVNNLPREGKLLEIGSFVGASAVAFAKEFKDKGKNWQIHTLDMFRGMSSHSPDPAVASHMKNYIMDGEEQLRLFKRNIEGWDITWEQTWLGTELEIEDYEPPFQATALFYDGDHTHKPLSRFLDKFGKDIPYIFVADYDLNFKGTFKAVNDFVEKHNRQFYVEDCASPSRDSQGHININQVKSPIACIL
mgnify:CR=1 FL=1|tara:strand:- start:681 stop:1277 length:597 start_codon:yes stop_codon:yes gene_type:complete